MKDLDDRLDELFTQTLITTWWIIMWGIPCGPPDPRRIKEFTGLEAIINASED